ncbi:hypothetical protein EIP86_005330 [Pleurotus ostreatoroseus]|nr:hypothetical protein EIP86_005330 [Pleurotus ostreatoroseus]
MTVDEYTEPPTPITSFSASIGRSDTLTRRLDTTIPSRSLVTPTHSPSASTAHTSSQDYTATFTTLTTLTPPYSSALTSHTGSGNSSVTTARTSGPTAASLLRTESGTDIVLSGLSYRDSSDASLLGDSCSYVTPVSRSTAQTPTPRESIGTLSSVDQDNCASPSQSSAYETADAASPSASESFMSLPDVSSFPDEEQDEEQGDSMPLLDSIDTLAETSSDSPEESPGEASDSDPSAEGADEPSAEVVSEPSVAAEETLDTTEPEEPPPPRFSEQGVGTEEPQVQIEESQPQSVELVEEIPKDATEPAVEHIMEDASVQACEEIEEPTVTEPVPAPQEAEPAVEQPAPPTEIIEEASAQPESEEVQPIEPTPEPAVEVALPPSPTASDALSALSLTIPAFPRSVQDGISQVSLTDLSDSERTPTERSATPIARQVLQSVMSTGDMTGTGLHIALDKSPSATATEDAWGAETDGSYDSSVLNMSPSSCSQFLHNVAEMPSMVVRVAQTPEAAADSASALTIKDSLMTPSLGLHETGAVTESGAVSEVQASLNDASLVSIAMARVPESKVSSISETESMSSSTFGESEVEAEVLRVPEASNRDDGSLVPSSYLDGHSLSTHDSPSLNTNLALPLLVQTIKPPVVRSLSVQCDSAEDIASLNFSGKLTLEADRIIEQLHVFEQSRTQDKLEVKGMLQELLELAKQEPRVIERWTDRLDRSVGGSVILSSSPAPSVHRNEVVDRSIGGSIIASSPCMSVRGIDRSVGGSILYSPPHSTREAAVSPSRTRLYSESDATISVRGIDRSVGGSILYSPPLSTREAAVSPSRTQLRSGSDAMSSKTASTVAPPAAEQEQVILLTPPPQRPRSADSMTDGMSYLSSHYSDDLELNAQGLTAGLEVEPVSPSWSGTLSDDLSNGSSLSKLTEELAKEPSHVSRLTTPPAITEAMPQENVTEPDVAVEPASTISHTQSSVAPFVAELLVAESERKATLPTLPAGVITSEENTAAEQPRGIHMPVPMRAGSPFDGQLAAMLKDSSPPSHYVQMAQATQAQEDVQGSQMAFPEPQVVADLQTEAVGKDVDVSPTRIIHTPMFHARDIKLAGSPSAVQVASSSAPPSQIAMSRSADVVDTVGVFYKGDVCSVTNTLQENLARLQEDNMRMHMENRLAQEENRRIYEEHRLAQEDMKANLLQMKDLLAGFLSSKPTVSMPMGIPPLTSFSSPMVYTAHVPNPSPASKFSEAVSGYPSYPPGAYLNPTPATQPAYLLPQMTASSLPPPPFMQPVIHDVVEPVIPPPPAEFVPAPVLSPSCSECTSRGLNDAQLPAMSSSSSVISDSRSPSVVVRGVNTSVVSADLATPAHIPLPASVITVASQLPIYLAQPAVTSSPASATPRSSRSLIISPSSEKASTIPDQVKPSPATDDKPQVLLSSANEEDATVSPSSTVNSATPKAIEPPSLPSSLDAASSDGPESSEAPVQEPLPPAESMLFNGSPADSRELGSSQPSGDSPSPSVSEVHDVVVVPPSFSSAQTSPITRDASFLDAPTSPITRDASPLDAQTSPIIRDASFLDAQTSPIANDASFFAHTQSEVEEPAPQVPPEVRQRDATQYVDQGVSSSPKTVSASTSPVIVLQDHAGIQATQSLPNSPLVVSASTSPFHSAVMVAADSQTDPFEHATTSLQAVSTATSPIQMLTDIASPRLHVERALSPIADIATVVHEQDDAVAQTEPAETDAIPREMADKAIVAQDDAVSMIGDKEAKRSSWHDAASQFRLLMESTQTTAHEALEVLRKTQALLDDVQRAQEVTLKDEPVLTEEEASPAEDQQNETLALLEADMVAMKESLDDAKASSNSQILNILNKLSDLQGIHEREVEHRTSQAAEQVAERERLLASLVSEKEHRITDLESDLAKLTEDSATMRLEHDDAIKQAHTEAEEREAAHLQVVEEHNTSINALRAEIESLQAEISALHEQRTQDEQLHMALDAEREEAFAEQDRLAAEDALMKEQVLAEREVCIAALREELEKKTLELQQAIEREGEVSSREASHIEKASQQTEAIEGLQATVSRLEEEYAQAKEDWETEKSGLEDAHAAEQKAAVERETELQAKIEQLQQELDKVNEELEKEIQRRLDDVAQLEATHAEAEKAEKDVALERERSFVEKYDAAVKEFKEELVVLRAAYEQAVAMQKSDATEQREADLAEARERAEQHVASLTELRDKLISIEERSEERWTQQLDKHGEITAQLDKMEEGASDERRKTDEYRIQRDEERAEAANKPSKVSFLVLFSELTHLAGVQEVVEERLREHVDQLREQLDVSANGIREDVARQHEEALGNVSGAVQEQTSNALSNCLEEMARQLEAIGDHQYTNLLDSMKTTIEQQVTLHISYYLGELGKLMDTQHAQQLTELLETVRSTMKEQVIYNVENYLDDLCRQLVPEISQLLKEVRDKAEEKHKLNRQIDVLRDIRREHEPGGRLFEGEAANHPGLKEFNKKAWRKHKSKSTDQTAPNTDTDAPPPAFEAPKQPLASYPAEPPPSWDSWSVNHLWHRLDK